MATVDDLKREFGARYIPLTQVTDKYFEWSANHSDKQARDGMVPFRIFKAVDSNKAPWLVDVYDLAEWMERRRNSAIVFRTYAEVSKEDFKKILGD